MSPDEVLHWRLTNGADQPLEHVTDRHGFIWRLVRDGGMASRADDMGILTIGIVALDAGHGPLTRITLQAHR